MQSTFYSPLIWNITEKLVNRIKRGHPWLVFLITISLRPTSSAPNISSKHLILYILQMAFVQFYYDPITKFDRLFEDALAARSCPRACAPSTEARSTTPRHRDVYHPR